MANAISDELRRRTDALKDVLHRAPREVGAIAVNHFKGNFRRQGFDGAKWSPRKKESRKSIGRAILVRSARLRNSLRVVRADLREIVVGTDAPYARIHNEGGTIVQPARSEIFKRNRYVKGRKKGMFARGVTTGKGFTYKQRYIKIPKRKFIGESKELTTKVSAWYSTNIKRAIKAT